MKIVDRLLKSQNFGADRHGQKIEAIVLHIMEGSIDGSEVWFNNETSDVSAHFGISKMGEVRRWVKEELVAWHAGTVVDPVSKLVLSKPGINPNYYTIGIEHEGQASDFGTESQLQASGELVAMLCAEFSIPLDTDHLILHREIRANKTCPGNLNRDVIMRYALDKLLSPKPASKSVLDPTGSIKSHLDTIELHVSQMRKELGL